MRERFGIEWRAPQKIQMPRKRRTTSAEKAPKLWIAPEWAARLHESRSSHALGSDFSRYLDLADRALAKEASNSAEIAETRSAQDEIDAAAHPSGNGLASEIFPEALLSVVAPRISLPKPPRHPVYPKPAKRVMPKPRATPKLQKPPTIKFPKPPSRNW
jgi:hypothetical protein